MSDGTPRSLSGLPLLRNDVPERRLDRVLAEPAAGELAGGPDPRAPRLDDAARALTLGLELAERGRDEVRRHPLALESPPDCGVAVTPIGERRGSPRCVA